jgi:YesN/AraC family two-component response regulator
MVSLKLKELRIKGMVCNRCINAVTDELDKLGATILEIKLGKALIKYPEYKISLQDFERVLKKHDFELIIDEDTKIVEAVKAILVELISDLPIKLTTNLSTVLVENIHKDYTYLSKLFSSNLGVTIEKYFIHLKIEKAKELIEAGQLNFTEISYDLGYSSVNYLSSQFKQITGMKMGEYKKLSHWDRKSLDKIL